MTVKPFTPPPPAETASALIEQAMVADALDEQTRAQQAVMLNPEAMRG